ncbi:MAG: hypothetical protein ISS49_02885 [Anaerolineae bacterium]|nr:hypothetical protein [Anaerolineae bacterium]
MEIRKRQWIPVLVLGLTLALALACGGTKETAPEDVTAATEAAAEAPAATEETAATEAPAAPPEDVRNIIVQSSADLKNLTSYRAKIIVETEGQTMESLYEYVLPDRFHQVSDFGETIGIGDDLYVKAGDTWTKISGGGTGTALAEVGVAEEDIVEARLEGTEDVDGVPCQKYVYTTEMEGSPLEITAWIGVEDGLPRKIVSKPASGGTVTQTLYDFNADITIEAPVTD